MTILQLISKGEIARETNQPKKALELFDLAIIRASDKKNYDALLSAISHKLVLWIHLYLKTQNHIWLELMASDAHLGLNLSDQSKTDHKHKSTFYLRIAQYYVYLHKYKSAHSYAKKAVLLSLKTSSYPETLGHLAMIEAYLNKPNWEKHFHIAISKLNKIKLREFHKLIILSGIYLRFAKAHARHHNKQKAKEYLLLARELADKLKRNHKMKIRMLQVNKLQKNINQPI